MKDRNMPAQGNKTGRAPLTYDLISKYRGALMGLTILGIMFFHFTEDCRNYDVKFHGLIKYYYTFIGSSGVDVFLALSGFGLFYSMKRKPNAPLRQFYWRRYTRILIPYLLVAVPSLLWRDVLVNHESILYFLKELSFVTLIQQGRTWYWYILMIGLCYLIFPYLFQLIDRAADDLSAQTRKLYPDAIAFAADMERLLAKMGFYSEDARRIAHHIVVEPARGSGHAWPTLGRKEDSRLRTRISDNGMDYKGYNIAVHEFGHCVEQVLDMYFIDHYMLSGVPNTAYTEASAFLWQHRDLQLLPDGKMGNGINNPDEVLDQFWSMYEIMGVSLVDMAMWRWIYAHPKTTAKELCEATQQIAKEIWNAYYEPILGEHDCILLAVYSHMVNAPMYLPNYPLGHIVQYQLEEHLAKCKTQQEFAQEYMRIYRLGRLTPKQWMIEAVGEAPSIDPILRRIHSVD